LVSFSKLSKIKNEMVKKKETPMKTSPPPKLTLEEVKKWGEKYGHGIYEFALEVVGKSNYRSRTWTEDLRAVGELRETVANHRSDIAAHAVLSALIKEKFGQKINWKKLAVMIAVHDLLYEVKFGTDFTPPIKEKMIEAGITKDLLAKFFSKVAESSCAGLPNFLVKTLLTINRESEEMRSAEAQIIREADCIAEMVQIDEWKESGLSSFLLEMLNKTITETEADELKSSPYVSAFLEGRRGKASP